MSAAKCCILILLLTYLPDNVVNAHLKKHLDKHWSTEGFFNDFKAALQVQSEVGQFPQIGQSTHDSVKVWANNYHSRLNVRNGSRSLKKK